MYGLGTEKGSWRNMLATVTLKKSFPLIHIEYRLNGVGHACTHSTEDNFVVRAAAVT